MASFSYLFSGPEDYKKPKNIGDQSNGVYNTYNLSELGSGQYNFSMNTSGYETINWASNNTNTAYGSMLNFSNSRNNIANLSGDLTNFHIKQLGYYNTINITGNNAKAANFVIGGIGNGVYFLEVIIR